MTRPTRKWTARAGLIILVAAWLRLTGLTSMEFKGDEQEALTLGMRLLEERPWSTDHPWPTHGMPSSNGVGNAPLFTWIIAAMWAPTQDPVAVTRLIALVNVLCLVPLWLWARRRMGEERALLTLAICAVSPFAVIFSRKIWAPEVMGPGVLALLWGIEWLRSGHAWRAILLFLAAALIVGQLHQSGPIALVLLPVAIGVQLFADHRRGLVVARLSRPSGLEAVALVAMVALNLFFWLPHLEYVMGLPPEIFANRPTLGITRFDLLTRTRAEITPSDLFYFFDPHRDDFLSNPVRWAFYYGANAFGVPLLVYGLWRWLRAPLSLPVLGVWWAIVILAFGLAQIPVHPWYVLTLAPLTAVLAAGGFDAPLPPSWLTRLLRGCRIGYIVALLGLTITTLSWLEQRGGADGDYGVAYKIRDAQAQVITGGMAARTIPLFHELGEVEAGASLPTCEAIPSALAWIVRWRSGREAPDSLRLCDGWIQQDGRAAYRWSFRVE